jgi:hypothetical protein
LLPSEDRLWVVSSSGIAYTTGGELEFELPPSPVADISPPFLFEGRRAAVRLTSSEPAHRPPVVRALGIIICKY